MQGWQRHKVYPDFVFAHITESGHSRMVLLETKGLHLQGPDTDYKKVLLERLSAEFRDQRFASAGELVLEGGRENLVCDLVFDAAWKGNLEKRYFGAGAARGAAEQDSAAQAGR